MAADGEDTKLEEQLRDVGARLQSAPDDAEGLLKLLSEVEAYLLKVGQSPPESTSSAIRPAMAALARKELLDHLNADVKLAVASCISEITRITAPEAPYDDDVMRDVFFIIVGAFQHLDEIDSPSFGRRISILHTVATVRSCVVMLDLECDDLIREMFHHFFRTVSSNHPGIVISSMLTTMKLVIEESEAVQTELASCLLRNVKNEEKETSPASFELAEKVIGLCQEKLKSVFLQLIQGTPLNEYSKIVTSVLDVREDNNVDPSGKDTEEGWKEEISRGEKPRVLYCLVIPLSEFQSVHSPVDLSVTRDQVVRYKRTTSNQANNKANSPYFAIIEQISFQEFKNKLLEPGLVDRIVVSNKSVAKVYVRSSPQLNSQSQNSDTHITTSDVPGKHAPSRYKYYFNIVSDDSFEEKLGKPAVEANGKKKQKKRVPFWLVLVMFSVFGAVMALPLMQL